MVVFPVPLTPTTSSTDGWSSCGSARTERSRSGCSSAISTSRSTARASASVCTSWLASRLRSSATTELVTVGPRSAISRVSSICSQESSSRSPPPMQAEQAAAQRILRSGEPAAQPLQPAFGRGDLLDVAGAARGGAAPRLGGAGSTGWLAGAVSGSGSCDIGDRALRARRAGRSRRRRRWAGPVVSMRSGVSVRLNVIPDDAVYPPERSRVRGLLGRRQADLPAPVPHQSHDQDGDDDQRGDGRDRDPQGLRQRIPRLGAAVTSWSTC